MQHDPLEPKSISKCARGCQWIKESISVRNVISVEAISCANATALRLITYYETASRTSARYHLFVSYPSRSE